VKGVSNTDPGPLFGRLPDDPDVNDLAFLDLVDRHLAIITPPDDDLLVINHMISLHDALRDLRVKARLLLEQRT
jgi:hypothetical protein